MSVHEYSQGICGDGAAILKDGQPMTPEQIIHELQVSQERTRVQNEKLDSSGHVADVSKMVVEDPDSDGLIESEIEISTPSGMITVAGLCHKDSPGLAVTMSPYGCFTVTHIGTGLRICDGYQRASSALLIMSQFALVADMKNKSWVELDKEGAAEMIRDAKPDEVPFDWCTNTSTDGTRKMTVGEWFQAVRLPVVDEFPWEETDPFDDALVNFGKLGRGEA